MENKDCEEHVFRWALKAVRISPDMTALERHEMCVRQILKSVFTIVELRNGTVPVYPDGFVFRNDPSRVVPIWPPTVST